MSNCFYQQVAAWFPSISDKRLEIRFVSKFIDRRGRDIMTVTRSKVGNSWLCCPYLLQSMHLTPKGSNNKVSLQLHGAFLLPVICPGCISDDNDSKLPLDSFHEIKSWPHHYRSNLFFDGKNVKKTLFISFVYISAKSVNRVLCPSPSCTILSIVWPVSQSSDTTILALEISAGVVTWYQPSSSHWQSLVPTMKIRMGAGHSVGWAGS